MRQYKKGRTIAALATPPGEGAIAILRVSGPRAIEIATVVGGNTIGQCPSHTARVGRILSSSGELIDRVLFLIFHAPRSYTGEQMVEIHCHGGILISRRVLERLLEAGADPALPGEFTFQAFYNGKIDLAQAEAVQLLISSRNDLAREAAADQLEGILSQAIRSLQQDLISASARLEALLDFPEEDLDAASTAATIVNLEKVCEKMRRLLATFHEGRMIHEGISLCLIGPPNVGKSSLMNALLGRERAIVTDIPGTTRDFLEEDLLLGSLRFRLIDTAGVRESQDPIEQEGVRRSLQARERCDICLLMLDASRSLTPSDYELLDQTPREKTILIWNKIDLAMPDPSLSWAPMVHLSIKQHAGLEHLREAIDRVVWQKGTRSREELLISSMRHYQSLKQASEACETAIASLRQGESSEFALIDLRSSLEHLGAILGLNVSEEILSSIFSQFCLGK